MFWQKKLCYTTYLLQLQTSLHELLNNIDLFLKDFKKLNNKNISNNFSKELNNKIYIYKNIKDTENNDFNVNFCEGQINSINSKIKIEALNNKNNCNNSSKNLNDENNFSKKFK